MLAPSINYHNSRPLPQSPKSPLRSNKENLDNTNNTFSSFGSNLKPIEDVARSSTERKKRANRRRKSSLNRRVSFSHTVDVRVFGRDEQCPDTPAENKNPSNNPYLLDMFSSCELSSPQATIISDQKEQLKPEADGDDESSRERDRDFPPRLLFEGNCPPYVESHQIPIKGDGGDTMDITQTYGGILGKDTTTNEILGSNDEVVAETTQIPLPLTTNGTDVHTHETEENKPTIKSIFDHIRAYHNIPIDRAPYSPPSPSPSYTLNVGVRSILTSLDEDDDDIVVVPPPRPVGSHLYEEEEEEEDNTTNMFLTKELDRILSLKPQAGTSVTASTANGEGEDMTFTKSLGNILSTGVNDNSVDMTMTTNFGTIAVTGNLPPFSPFSAPIRNKTTSEHYGNVATANLVDIDDTDNTSDMAMTKSYSQIPYSRNNLNTTINTSQDMAMTKNYSQILSDRTNMVANDSFGEGDTMKISGPKGLINDSFDMSMTRTYGQIFSSNTDIATNDRPSKTINDSFDMSMTKHFFQSLSSRRDSTVNDSTDMSMTKNHGQILSARTDSNANNSTDMSITKYYGEVLSSRTDPTAYDGTDMSMTKNYGEILSSKKNFDNRNPDDSLIRTQNLSEIIASADEDTDMMMTMNYGGVLSSITNLTPGLSVVTTETDVGTVAVKAPTYVHGVLSPETASIVDVEMMDTSFTEQGEQTNDLRANTTVPDDDMALTRNYGAILNNNLFEQIVLPQREDSIPIDSSVPSVLDAAKSAEGQPGQVDFNSFLQRANVRFLDDFSTKTRRGSSIGYMTRGRGEGDMTGEISVAESRSMRKQLEAAFVVKPQLDVMQWGCETLGQLTAEMNKCSRNAEEVLSENPPALFEALQNAKDLPAAQRSLKMLKNLCKQQAQKTFFEWRVDAERSLSAVLKNNLQLIQEDKAKLTEKMEHLSQLRTQISTDKATAESRIASLRPIVPVVKENKAVQSEVASPSKIAATEKTLLLQGQINDKRNLLKKYTSVLMWQPQILTPTELLFNFERSYKVHILLHEKGREEKDMNSGAIKKATFSFTSGKVKVEDPAVSSPIPCESCLEFHASLLRAAQIEDLLAALKTTKDLQHTLQQTSFRLCRINRLLSEIRDLSHRYNLRTSNIRQIRSLVIPPTNSVVEFEFSCLATMTKILVAFEIGINYPFEAMPLHIKILFGGVSKENIENVVRMCEPGYGLLGRICVGLKRLVSTDNSL